MAPDLFVGASAGATLALALVALTLFLADRSRRTLALFAALGAVVGATLLERVAPTLAPAVRPEALRVAFSSGRGLVALAALAVLVTAWRSRRRGTERAALFASGAILLLAVLLDAAQRSGVFPTLDLPLPLLGPAFILFSLVFASILASDARRVVSRATTDPLTGLPSRAAFFERAGAEIARAERLGRTLALVMLDVDHFKSFNDRYGHQTGDRVLQAAAHAIARTIRGIDVAGRYGGEEFCLLVVEVDEESAVPAVERVRAAISALGPPAVPERITASAGVAFHHGLFERASVAALLKRADAALYEAKSGGRDRTTLETRPDAVPRSAAEVRYR